MMNKEITKPNEQNILVGIDVGSTTTKIVALDADHDHQLLFSDYARHHANQIASVIKSIKEFCSHIKQKKHHSGALFVCRLKIDTRTYFKTVFLM